MSPRVREILSWYGADNPGVLKHLAQLLNQGKLKGTGKLLVLGMDEGLTQGPGLAFAQNPDSFDPCYGFDFSLLGGLSGYTAPLGALESSVRDYAGEMPLLLEIPIDWGSVSKRAPSQGGDGMGVNGGQALTVEMESWDIRGATLDLVERALELGCVGVHIRFRSGIFASDLAESSSPFLLNPGLRRGEGGLGHLASLVSRIRQRGLIAMGSLDWVPLGAVGLVERPKKETMESVPLALDDMAWMAHRLAQWGFHIVSLPTPESLLSSEDHQKFYLQHGIRVKDLADRTRHMIHSTFNGKRILIFSERRFQPAATLLSAANEMARGGAFGCLITQNAFQRPKRDALELCEKLMEAFAGKSL